MKRITLFLCSIILLPIGLLSQSDIWPVHAVTNSGKKFPINVYLADGTAVPVFAIYAEGNDHFMDVKGVHNGDKISIKLIESNDVLVPVKGITQNGEILKVKAVGPGGRILDVKGVSRDGNTLNLAAIGQDGRNILIKAISADGVERPVKGVKFVGQNVELTFGDINVIGHVKALPIIEVGNIDSKWNVCAYTDTQDSLKLVAINKKGKEYQIKAHMEGQYPYLMNVKGEARINLHIKLVKEGNGLILTGIDEYGRLYDVKAISENGDTYVVHGGETTGNVTPVYVVGPDGKTFPVKAVSSKGHVFDVKGLKVKEGEVEGVISGLNNWIRYYSHVKAIAPAQ